MNVKGTEKGTKKFTKEEKLVILKEASEKGVTVLSKPTNSVFSSVNTQCNSETGVLKMNPSPTKETFYAITENGDTLQTTNNSISQVGAGNYTVFYVDTNGCKSNDSIVKVGYFNNVTANFTVNPESGAAPLSVQINNTSQNATTYNWSINGNLAGNATTPNQSVFDTSGSYQVQLIAYGSNPACTDTLTKTIVVYDSLVVEIPNVFSPNNDGINDVFTIKSNIEIATELQIVNRWGNVVYVFKGNLQQGTNVLWNGASTTSTSSVAVTDGVYFYTAIFTLDKNKMACSNKECTVEKEGFVHVVR